MCLSKNGKVPKLLKTMKNQRPRQKKSCKTAPLLNVFGLCGEKLIQAKAKCRHGEWLPWLEANCNVSQPQASKYVRLANNLPELSNYKSTYSLDSIETAIAYLSASDEVKEQVNNSPDPATERQIKELKTAILSASRSRQWLRSFV